MMNKKGISPLIATVLIIGFTIAIAVVVIIWITSVVGDITCVESCNIEGQNICRRGISDLEIEPLIDSNINIINGGYNKYNFVLIWLFEGETLQIDEESIIESYSFKPGAYVGPGGHGAQLPDSVKLKYSVSVNVTDCPECNQIECGELGPIELEI